MSRLTGAPGLLKTCCEASRGCEAYSTVTGDLAYSGPADYDSGTRGATCALTGAQLPQDPLEDSGGVVGGHIHLRRDYSEPQDCCAQDCESEKPWRSPHRSKHTRVYLQARACVQVYLTVRSRDFDPETVLPKIANPRNHREADTNANTRGFIYKLELVSKYTRHSGAGTWTPRTPWRTLEAPLGATSISERTPLNHRGPGMDGPVRTLNLKRKDLHFLGLLASPPILSSSFPLPRSS
ncbi:uncharacterized protein LOC118353533 isoform X17 [Canis lupus dingo]|uniref:uncharacterized protein LOC118353533 isoform X17 n=1 Tax=Canis lupus dingo TaxID=286419 RepID=UPI0020C561D9|nr:uncharacterized protein LOC118353533 isoform X17 [Canis lupus dingo]